MQKKASLSGRMLIFDGLDFQTRVIKLRPRQSETCEMCRHLGQSLSHQEITELISRFDYEFFCGVSNYNDKSTDINLLDNEKQRISCQVYKEIVDQMQTRSHLLIDVRPKCQFNICSLSQSLSTFLLFQ